MDLQTLVHTTFFFHAKAVAYLSRNGDLSLRSQPDGMASLFRGVIAGARVDDQTVVLIVFEMSMVTSMT